MATIIRFSGGGERTVADGSFVMNEMGVHYTDETPDGRERLHMIPWSVIHEIVQERESVVLLPGMSQDPLDLTVA